MASQDLDNLIALMAKLPGLGPRSARRAVLQMIK
ncbi:MAG: recombination protein RecR, partial [Yoonia sp.]